MKEAPSENRGRLFEWGGGTEHTLKTCRLLLARGDHVHYPLASPIHGGGGPRKRWKGLASGDNASYSFLHHSGGTPFGGWRHHLCPGGKCVTGFSVAQGLPTNPVPLPPRFAVGRWVLGGVPHDFNGKRREAYFVPCIEESPAQPDKGGCGGPA